MPSGGPLIRSNQLRSKVRPFIKEQTCGCKLGRTSTFTRTFIWVMDERSEMEIKTLLYLMEVVQGYVNIRLKPPENEMRKTS